MRTALVAATSARSAITAQISHHQDPDAPDGPVARPSRRRRVPLPYLIVLAGIAAGLFVAWQGSQYAGRGTALVGGALLAAAAARLVLPPRFAGLLASRGKAADVAALRGARRRGAGGRGVAAMSSCH